MQIFKITYELSLNKHIIPFAKKNDLLDFTISAVIIVKNEESVITRCLESIVDKFDEIIIVDTGSTDKTINKIKKFNKRVKLFFYTWCDDFSLARNYALKKATMDYIFIIDSDEVLLSSKHEVKHSYSIFRLYGNDISFALCPTIIGSDGDRCISIIRGFENNRDINYFGNVHEELRFGKNHISIKKSPLEIYHDGYNINTVTNKNKTIRNTSLLKLVMKKEPHNLRWLYFYVRDGFNTIPPETIIKLINNNIKINRRKRVSINNIIKSDFTFALVDILARVQFMILYNKKHFLEVLNVMDTLKPGNSNSFFYKEMYDLSEWKRNIKIKISKIANYLNSKIEHQYGMINSSGYHIDSLLAYYLYEDGNISRSHDILDYLDKLGYQTEMNTYLLAKLNLECKKESDLC